MTRNRRHPGLVRRCIALLDRCACLFLRRTLLLAGVGDANTLAWHADPATCVSVNAPDDASALGHALCASAIHSNSPACDAAWVRNVSLNAINGAERVTCWPPATALSRARTGT